MVDELHQEDSQQAVAVLPTLKAPFPYFGGKSRAAHLIWPRFGPVANYVEPFAGSLAVLLARPHPPFVETINDRDAMIANFWRALKFAPEAVADFADAPVNEADLHAIHMWLVNQEEFRERMLTDPDYYDPKIAGWWLWGRCAWIAGGWCDFEALSDRSGRMGRSIPNMNFQGVHSERIQREGVHAHMIKLAQRLRRVRVCCGDWSRLCTPAVCTPGPTAILLDPPYFDDLSTGLYAHSDKNVSAQVRQWAIENGDNPEYRIALCGYEGEHPMPPSWEKVSWKATGGYGLQRRDGSNQNQERERIWFSPHCLKVTDNLFASEMSDDEDYDQQPSISTGDPTAQQDLQREINDSNS